MGFPFDKPSWTDAAGPIFTGAGGSMMVVYSLIAIGICIAVLAIGQKSESKSYSKKK